MLQIALVISVMKIKDALGYRQRIRLSQPDLKDWLDKEKEIFLSRGTDEEPRVHESLQILRQNRNH